MADQLIDYEALCKKICAPETDTEGSDVEQKPDITLIEVSSDGEFSRRDLTPELLRTHIENDTKVCKAFEGISSYSWSTDYIQLASRLKLRRGCIRQYQIGVSLLPTFCR